MAAGETAGRVEGRLGQIGDSITESSAYFRNAVMNGVLDNETGHDYVPIRSWLSYSGKMPPDANSFYRNHGKGPDYGNLGGWKLPDAVAAGHPAQGVLTGDGVLPGDYSWVLVMLGTNDIDEFGWNAATWKGDLRDLVLGYVALDVLPVVSTIPPEAAHVGDGRVEGANQAILEVAQEEQLPWVDFHALVLHHQPVNWHGTLIGGDGTHPSAATGGRGFSQLALTSTDGYALRTKLTFDVAEKLKAIVWDDGAADPTVEAPDVAPVAADAIRAWPNPFRDTVTIRADGAGPIVVLDLAGRRLRTLAAGGRGAFVTWDGRDDAGRSVPAGVYWVRGRDGTRAERIVRLR